MATTSLQIIYISSSYCNLYNLCIISLLPHISGYGDRGGSKPAGNYNYGGKLMVCYASSLTQQYISVKHTGKIVTRCCNKGVKVTCNTKGIYLHRYVIFVSLPGKVLAHAGW